MVLLVSIAPFLGILTAAEPQPNFVPHCRALSYWRADAYPLKVWFEDPDTEPAFWEGARAWTEGTGGFVRFLRVENESEAQITVVVEFQSGIARADTVIRRRGEQLLSARIRLQPADTDSAMVMAHELGHALGVSGHSPVPGDLMYRTGNEPLMLMPRDVNTFWIAHRRQLRPRR